MILQADARHIPLADNSVQCVVTSPPYWGLRDYNVNGQLGLERTPEEYIANMVAVFREVRRVLREDGTCWVNMGDGYWSGGKRGSGGVNEWSQAKRSEGQWMDQDVDTSLPLKPKDLIGMPWRLAFALQADGWWLRSDIVWAKPNPMPESVTDRPTKSHEYVLLFAKGLWKSRVVKFSDLPGECVHFGQDLGLQSSDSWTSKVCVRLASSIFYAAQIQHNFSLPPFYSEEWKQRSDGSDSDFVCSLPEVHGPAVWSARFLSSCCTTKQFLGELNRLSIALTDHDDLLIGDIPSESQSPAINSYRDGTITVQNSGEICKFDFLHNEIIISRPSSCVYYFDQEAVREPVADGTAERYAYPFTPAPDGVELSRKRPNGMRDVPTGRNLRSVWTIQTQPYPEAHFATFPEEIPKRCILAGTSARGCCPVCGAPWDRVVERKAMVIDRSNNHPPELRTRTSGTMVSPPESTTTGWRPTCTCQPDSAAFRADYRLPPCIVLDPFAGSGTTVAVAESLGRRGIGLELSWNYIALARKRLSTVTMGLPL